MTHTTMRCCITLNLQEEQTLCTYTGSDLKLSPPLDTGALDNMTPHNSHGGVNRMTSTWTTHGSPDSLEIHIMIWSSNLAAL